MIDEMRAVVRVCKKADIKVELYMGGIIIEGDWIGGPQSQLFKRQFKCLTRIWPNELSRDVLLYTASFHLNIGHLDCASTGKKIKEISFYEDIFNRRRGT